MPRPRVRCLYRGPGFTPFHPFQRTRTGVVDNGNLSVATMKPIIVGLVLTHRLSFRQYVILLAIVNTLHNNIP